MIVPDGFTRLNVEQSKKRRTATQLFYICSTTVHIVYQRVTAKIIFFLNFQVTCLFFCYFLM